MPGIARGDGRTWAPLGAGPGFRPRSVTVRPTGELVACGSAQQTNGSFVGYVAQWNGATWTSIGTAVGAETVAATLANGDVVVGGAFTSIDNIAVPGLAVRRGGVWAPLGNLARLQATCPASVTQLGAGCPSSGGGNALTATRPWTGAVWTARGSGLPSGGAALSCLGFSTVAVPLRALIAQGQLGCTLFALPEYTALLPVVAGAATVNVAVPADVRLAGARFHHQLVPIEFTAAGGIRAVTATDALTLTIGSY